MRVWLPLLLSGLIAVTATLDAAAVCGAQPATAIGTHGMVLLDADATFVASHMPMPHPPHDRQVVLELSIGDEPTTAAVKAAIASSPGLWTLEPERFDLHRLAPDAPAPIGQFQASIYQGHFERGGTARFKDVRIRVRRVLAYRALQVTDADHGHETYRSVSTARGVLLFREVRGTGDVDHIAVAEACPDLDGVTVSVAGQNATAVALEEALTAAIQRRGCWTVPVKTLYFESEDFK